MVITFYTLSLIFLATGILPVFRNKHWIFRAWEFGYIQITVLQILIFLVGFWFGQNKNVFFWIVSILLIANILYHILLLVPFTPLYRLVQQKNKIVGKTSKQISLIAINVYQPNKSYHKLIELIDKYQPDILLTMESDKEWEKGLKSIETIYSETVKVPMENTYGMHLYSRLKLKDAKVNYFVSDDIPSISALISAPDGTEFKFFGIHPPPPSPSEEETSKERDGEMMSVAKIIRERENDKIVVVGDFNNVAWAATTRRFRKVSGLIDPRFGRGLVSTFHAKYPFLRIPIDLMYHGEKIIIDEFKRLEPIDSDHFPLFCSFRISELDAENSTEKADKDDLEEIKEDIAEGKSEQGNRKDLD